MEEHRVLVVAVVVEHHALEVEEVVEEHRGDGVVATRLPILQAEEEAEEVVVAILPRIPLVLALDRSLVVVEVCPNLEVVVEVRMVLELVLLVEESIPLVLVLASSVSLNHSC